MVVPPDEFRLLSGEELSFDLRGLNAFSAWSYDHLLIAATLIQETSMLVLTPPGLLLQWRDELDEKFGLQFTLIENAAGFARVQEELPAGVNSWDALPRVLTSVDFIKKETVRNRVLRKSWDLIIVDEAHGLALRDHARGLIFLSATRRSRRFSTAFFAYLQDRLAQWKVKAGATVSEKKLYPLSADTIDSLKVAKPPIILPKKKMWM